MARQTKLSPKTERAIGTFVVVCVLVVLGALVVKFIQWLF